MNLKSLVGILIASNMLLKLEAGWFSIWKEVLKEVGQLKMNSSFVVGKGDKVRFLEDICCNESPV